ncbi:MAG: VanZ family protein [Eubacteriales bacterium]|nr:VanZ family protein [Eubacteriales bacterium]
MRSYIEPILTAAWLFPLVAAMITFPYMVHQYRRYGAILLLRTVILYSFVLYLMCAYFLTMLPLPSRAIVAGLTTPYLQLTPFTDVVRWVRQSGFVFSDLSTWSGLIVNRDLFIIVANVVMMIPLGIYLRYYFSCSLKKTVLITLGVSLIFELTQLSALFGIYPRPYRLCETDDLMTNTLGGLIGYWLAKPLTHLLPSRARMDELAYRRAAHVSVTRRITAAIMDWLLLGGTAAVATVFVPPLRALYRGADQTEMLITLGILYAAMVMLYFIFGEWLQKGLTIGKRLTHLRLVDARDDSRPKLWQCAVRYSLLYYGVIPLPFGALLFLQHATDDDNMAWPTLLIWFLLMLIYTVCVVWTILRVLNRSSQLPHSALSRTRIISTLVPPEKAIADDNSVRHA